jgi:hypothetical protein
VHLDYVFADNFYAWNQIDLSHINENGGGFNRVVILGDGRSGRKSTSKGLSVELLKKINKYDKSILVTTTQIQKDDRIYYPFTTTSLNDFIREINIIARKKQNYLFIIKYKKGEYKLLEDIIRHDSEALANVSPVYSDIPLKLEYDQFEDILEKTDLLISICNWSTTIWQAMAKKIPSIACNNDLEPSFLSSYENVEVKFSSLNRVINYWLDISDDDLNKYFKKIGAQTNIYLNGYQLMMDDLYHEFKA